MTELTVITRQEAHAQGLKRFYTGKPCERNHCSERYVSSGNCIECVTFKTPSKRKGPSGSNVHWATRPFVFELQPAPTQEEMQAALNMVRARRWHDAAVLELRKDPTLLAAHLDIIPVAEVSKADALIHRRNAQLAAMHAAQNAKPVTDEGSGS